MVISGHHAWPPAGYERHGVEEHGEAAKCGQKMSGAGIICRSWRVRWRTAAEAWDPRLVSFGNDWMILDTDEYIVISDCIIVCMQAMKGAVGKKTEKLRQQLGEHGACSDLLRLRLPLLLDPTIMLEGVLPEQSFVFKSAMSPLRLTFNIAGPSLPAIRVLVPIFALLVVLLSLVLDVWL